MNNWAGLWYTDEGYFVLVDDHKECYILNNKGKIYCKLKINEQGETDLCGKLMVRRRGEESLVQGTSICWPILQEAQ
jgi:hypothetical protein